MELPDDTPDDTEDEQRSLPEFILLISRPKWMRRAACRGLDPSLFFPERGELVSEEARQVCAECPVQPECLEYALTTKERDGVWGGRSGRQRRDMRAAIIDRNRERECIECGRVFMGNYRSKLCSTDCRRIRNTKVRAIHQQRKEAADEGSVDDRIEEPRDADHNDDNGWG